MCGSMADIQSAAAEIRRGKKKKEEGRTNHSMKIYMVSLFHRATIFVSYVLVPVNEAEQIKRKQIDFRVVMAALCNRAGHYIFAL